MSVTPQTKAWRKVVEAFATPVEHRTDTQLYITRWGLCHALYECGSVTSQTKAWREVARIFATPWEHRTPAEKKMSKDGLCYALDQLGHKDAYDAFVAYRDEDPAIDSWAGWWWPIRRKGGWQKKYDDLRATFAGLMAAMTQEERNLIVEGL